MLHQERCHILHTFEQFDTIKIYYKIFNQTLALFRLKNCDANKKIMRELVTLKLLNYFKNSSFYF